MYRNTKSVAGLDAVEAATHAEADARRRKAVQAKRIKGREADLLVRRRKQMRECVSMSVDAFALERIHCSESYRCLRFRVQGSRFRV